MHVAAVLSAYALAGSVSLVWIDPSGTAPFAYSAAREEATETLREAGIEARWRRGGPSQVLRGDEVAVVLMPGSSPHSTKDRRILGAAKRGEDAVAAVWVYVSAVKWTLGLERSAGALLTPVQRLALGRALGRVAAHETLHALLPRLPHAESGLMSEQFDRRSLLAPRVYVDAQTRAAVQDLATQRSLEASTPVLIQDGKLLSPDNFNAKAHLLGTSAPLHGPERAGFVPCAECPRTGPARTSHWGRTR
jgi:hypothetical protein